MKYPLLSFELKPQIVFVEGGHDTTNWLKEFSNEKEAIKRGEMAYISYLAQERNIPLKTWEPEFTKELQLLEKKFSKEEIFVFYVLQMIGQNIRLGKPKESVAGWIEEIRERTNWEGFEYSFTHVEKIHKKIFGKPISYDKKSVEQYSFNPYLDETILNRIAATNSRLRDEHAVRVILGAFKKYDRVLAIMGWSHTAVQEPSYNEYFGIE